MSVFVVGPVIVAVHVHGNATVAVHEKLLNVADHAHGAVPVHVHVNDHGAGHGHDDDDAYDHGF